MSSYAEKIEGRCCRMCGSGWVELHHLLPRSKFSKRHKKLQDHPDNCVPLCHKCHQDHHTTSKKLPRVMLAEAELQFLNDNIHPSWIDKWYPDGD